MNLQEIKSRKVNLLAELSELKGELKITLELTMMLKRRRMGLEAKFDVVQQRMEQLTDKQKEVESEGSQGG